MLISGFKFGMLLQIAVGPICIFIFQTASLRGFYSAEAGVLGVTIVDGLYIFAAILGLSSIIDKRNIKLGLKVFGAFILFIFGLSSVLSQFNINFLPSLSLQNMSSSNNVFYHSIMLTASNPLTIVFWAGVFSNKITEGNMRKEGIYSFGCGALLSTVLFLSLIALAGSLTTAFLTASIIQLLNLIVGLLLIYFSFRMILRKV